MGALDGYSGGEFVPISLRPDREAVLQLARCLAIKSTTVTVIPVELVSRCRRVDRGDFAMRSREMTRLKSAACGRVWPIASGEAVMD